MTSPGPAWDSSHPSNAAVSRPSLSVRGPDYGRGQGNRQSLDWRGVVASAVLLLTLSCLTLASPASAADAKFRLWLEALWPEAEAMGISRATFESAFDGVEPDRSLPDLAPPKGGESRGQAEFIKSPGAYISESQIQTLAKAGRERAEAWKSDLDKIEKHYGVPREIILGIWGRETVYGTHKLPHYAIEVLATQAYLGRRKDYFKNELLWALKMIEDGHARISEMKSSWGGAMGLTQMLPTNFRDFAEDFDGDGRRDIWTSIPDSLASTARSLLGAKHIDGSDASWIADQPWGYEVRKPEKLDCTLEGVANRRPIAEWVKLGFARSHDRKFKESQLDDEAFRRDHEARALRLRAPRRIGCSTATTTAELARKILEELLQRVIVGQFR